LSLGNLVAEAFSLEYATMIFRALVATLLLLIGFPVLGDSRRVVLQSTSSDCGPAALATLLTHYHKVSASEREIIRLTGIDKRTGTSLTALREASAAKGCTAESFRMNFDTLMQQVTTFRQPVIVRTLNPEPHFSLFLGGRKDLVYLADPASGNIAISRTAFLQRWLPRGSREGYVLVVAGPAPDQSAAVRTWVIREIERQQTSVHGWQPVPVLHR
jgi:predicted double-glycine peptidase